METTAPSPVARAKRSPRSPVLAEPFPHQRKARRRASRAVTAQDPHWHSVSASEERSVRSINPTKNTVPGNYRAPHSGLGGLLFGCHGRVTRFDLLRFLHPGLKLFRIHQGNVSGPGNIACGPDKEVLAVLPLHYTERHQGETVFCGWRPQLPRRIETRLPHSV